MTQNNILEVNHFAIALELAYKISEQTTDVDDIKRILKMTEQILSIKRQEK